MGKNIPTVHTLLVIQTPPGSNNLDGSEKHTYTHTISPFPYSSAFLIDGFPPVLGPIHGSGARPLIFPIVYSKSSSSVSWRSRSARKGPHPRRTRAWRGVAWLSKGGCSKKESGVVDLNN